MMWPKATCVHRQRRESAQCSRLEAGTALGQSGIPGYQKDVKWWRDVWLQSWLRRGLEEGGGFMTVPYM